MYQISDNLSPRSILLFVFSYDWILVVPASYHNLKSIAAITEGEEDMNIVASPSFKDYYIKYLISF